MAAFRDARRPALPRRPACAADGIRPAGGARPRAPARVFRDGLQRHAVRAFTWRRWLPAQAVRRQRFAQALARAKGTSRQGGEVLAQQLAAALAPPARTPASAHAVAQTAPDRCSCARTRSTDRAQILRRDSMPAARRTSPRAVARSGSAAGIGAVHPHPPSVIVQIDRIRHCNRCLRRRAVDPPDGTDFGFRAAARRHRARWASDGGHFGSSPHRSASGCKRNPPPGDRYTLLANRARPALKPASQVERRRRRSSFGESPPLFSYSRSCGRAALRAGRRTSAAAAASSPRPDRL